jgi:cobalt-zinc-cadmium efflux system outer membrane protein
MGASPAGSASAVAAAPVPASPASPAAAPSASPAAAGAAAKIPASLSLDEALRIFHEHGYDLLLADLAVASAEGDVLSAGAIANPQVSAAGGSVIGYDPGQACAGGQGGCSAASFSVGLSDSGALLDTLVGKRRLRLKVARAAFEVARAQRADAQRQLDLQVKAAWVGLAVAARNLEFAKEVQAVSEETLKVNKARFPGKIDEGSLARIETAKLSADSQVDVAEQAVRAARVSLAYLLGVRGAVPDFAAADGALKYSVPAALASATAESLERTAKEHRPDLEVAARSTERAEASLDLAKRQRVPDFVLSAQYSQTGTGQNALSPPLVLFGLTVTLPVFYAQSGEIRRAEADLSAQKITERKTEAVVTSDVGTAFESFTASKKLVERMETGGLLDRSKRARDITEAQYLEGKANLTDFLDAQRTFVATKQEYFQDLGNYWTAVYSLEAAVGTDLRK